MKFSFQFSNLYGTVYRTGDLVFTPDGNTVLSPVGNKISMFDLKNHKSETLPVESRFNYTTAALSPNGLTLLAVNEDGEVHLISLISRTVLHRLRTNRNIRAIRFSPDSKHFALTKEDCAFVYRNPGGDTRDYSPFVMERVLKGAYDETTCFSWTSCSRVLAVGAKDMTVRIYALHTFKNFTVCSLGGMTDPVVGVHFEGDSLDCYSLSSGGQLAVWESSLEPGHLEIGESVRKGKKKKKKKEEAEEEESEDDGGKEVEDEAETIEASEKSNEAGRLIYKRSSRHFLRDHVEEGGRRATLTCSDYHQKTKVLVAGFDTGTFLLVSLPDASIIHSLAISDQPIAALTFNASGDWIAFGCPDLGQLLVWEWQSETYVLKQQGHASSMTCLAYSPDGSVLATGGQDAKVKLWSTASGFCFVTFAEHESGVTGLCFTPSGKVVLSAGLDGTVRAFDMARYRNFKTLTTPRPVQLSCVSVDAGGDLIVAGGQDVFEIYLWSLATGRLLEILSGHEGPVSALAFSPSPTSSQLASVSWDKTLKIWDALENSSSREAIQLVSEGIAVAWRPDGQSVSVSTLSGQILTFNPKTAIQTGSIVGKKDLRIGKGESDKITAKKKSESSHFTSLCYSADGTVLLAAGNSKYICIYHVTEQLLLKKFEVTQNRSFDAMDETLNRRKMSEFGNLALIEDRSDGTALKLPGSKHVDMSSRAFKLEVRVAALRFSPTGRSFAAVTTEGLLVYSLDRHLVFDPYQLELNITPRTIRLALTSGDYSRALVTAFKLNEVKIIREVFERIPSGDVSLLAKEVSLLFLPKFLNFLGEELEQTRHFAYYLNWILALLLHHGRYIKENSNALMPVLNLLTKNLTRMSEDLGKVCDYNRFTVKYLLQVAKRRDSSSVMELATDSEEEEKDGREEDEGQEDVDMEELAAKWSDDDD